MVDADRRQRHQRRVKIGKVGGIDIQLSVPADQSMNAPRHALQMMDFLRPATFDVETNGSNPCAVEFPQLVIRNGLRHLRDSDKGRAKDLQSMKQIRLIE